MRPKTLARWRRLTLLAQGQMPEMVLLEDANDLCDFLESTGRTVRRTAWAEESIAAVREQMIEGYF